MTAGVDRCSRCGHFIYLLSLWVTGEVIAIDAGTKTAILVEDLKERVADLPALRMTEEEPVEVFTRHKCKGVPR